MVNINSHYDFDEFLRPGIRAYGRSVMLGGVDGRSRTYPTYRTIADITAHSTLRPHRTGYFPVMDLALDPPEVASAKDTGMLLDVAAVGIDQPATIGRPYLRLTDGTTYQVPDPLTEWAITLIAVHQQHRATGNETIFPCQIEFGILHGTMYAELL